MTFWLASFPRSGNTLLRQMLHSGWGIFSGSVYPEDLGHNIELIRSCGHVELNIVQGEGGRRIINPQNALVKTHNAKALPGKTIYVVRDGRWACVSFWHFMNKRTSLSEIVRGNTFAGSWSDHAIEYADKAEIVSWIRYEDLVSDPTAIVAQLAKLFGMPQGDALAPLARRDEMSRQSGGWVRKASDWTQDWSPELERIFRQTNGAAMARFYPDAGEAC